MEPEKVTLWTQIGYRWARSNHLELFPSIYDRFHAKETLKSKIKVKNFFLLKCQILIHTSQKRTRVSQMVLTLNAFSSYLFQLPNLPSNHNFLFRSHPVKRLYPSVSSWSISVYWFVFPPYRLTTGGCFFFDIYINQLIFLETILSYN